MVENQLAGYMFVASAGGVNEKFSGSMLFCNPTTSKKRVQIKVIAIKLQAVPELLHVAVNFDINYCGGMLAPRTLQGEQAPGVRLRVGSA